EERNKFSFVVARTANKISIGKEIERLYNVQVEAVNTMTMPGKIKMKNSRTGMIKGRKPAYKKAIITVADGESIDLYGEV
ncbi:UNVERIFIED_CONTAM: hypothetical protein GTU68_012658, partial [Idotea baltica]|nr:hypothetical protein [Idotea baltica]